MNNEYKALYEAVSNKFSIGTFEEFEARMQSPEDRKRFYDAVSKKGFSLGGYDDYEERLKKILKDAHGFVYYVAVTGITGTKSASVNDVKNKIKVIKKITNLPVIAGFGIKNSVDAKKMSSISDGIVIGSSLVNKIEEVYKKKNGLNEIFNFLKSFK